MFKDAYLEHEEKLSARLREVLRLLRERAFAAEPGTLIGREAEMCEQLGCSTSMLRQAARQLEVQGLIYIRRGARGGYVASRPTSRPAIDIAAFYLMGQGVSLRAVLDGAMPSVREAVRMAVDGARGAAARERMERLLASLCSRFAEDTSVEDFIDEESAIDDVLLFAAGNLPMTLFIKMMNRYARKRFGSEMFDRRPHRRIVYRKTRTDMLQAILTGDPDGALQALGRTEALSREWLSPEALDAPITPDD